MADDVTKPEETESTDQKTSLLNLMRYWLFGTFVIVFAGTFVYIAMFTNGRIGAALAAGWPIWAITAGLCIATYFGYAWYLKRKLGG